jgi:hypothetical protein
VGVSMAQVCLGVASGCDRPLVDSWVASVHTSHEVVDGEVAEALTMLAPMVKKVVEQACACAWPQSAMLPAMALATLVVAMPPVAQPAAPALTL